MKRTVIKLSMQSTVEEQRRVTSCAHVWKRVHGFAWDYLKLDDQCELCGTYRRRRRWYERLLRIE